MKNTLFGIIAILMLSLTIGSAMATYEDFTTYTEVDPNSHITKNATQVTATLVTQAEDAYVYKDFGAGYFSGDFTHAFDFQTTGGSSGYFPMAYMLTNNIDDTYGLTYTSGYEIFGVRHAKGNGHLYLHLNTSGDDCGVLAFNPYFVKVSRISGTVYAGIYSTSALRDSGNATDGDVCNLNVQTSIDYRYVMIQNSYNNGAGSQTQSGYTRYLDLNAGTPPTPEYFEITAIDEYDLSTITTFNATVNGTFYNTTNGTISTNIPSNSTGLIDIIVRANNYFNKQYNSYNASSNLEAELFQADLTLEALEKITNNTLSGSFEINGTLIIGNNIHIKAGTYEVTFINASYYNKYQNITVSALFNGTINITGIYNTILNITATNAYTTNKLQNFSGWIYDTSSGYNESYTTTNYEAHIGLLKERNYTIYATNPEYAIDDDLNYKNRTWTNNLYNLTFNLYTNNSIRIRIYDENTGLLITPTNITLILSSNESEVTYSTTDGTLFIENIEDNEYTLKFSGGNYTLKSYIVTVADRSTQILNAYLTTSTETVIFSIKDGDTYNVIEGASITMYRLINSSWSVIETKLSDITGRVQLSYLDGVNYKFYVSKTGYNDKIFYLNPVIFSSYNINLDKDTIIEEDLAYLGVNINYYPKSFYFNQTNNFTWIIQSPEGEIDYYYINISYPNSSYYEYGNNAIGGEITHSFLIVDSDINDRVTINYCYKSIIGVNEQCYQDSYLIIGVYEDQSFTSLKDNTFGLSIFERIIIVTITLIIVAGLITIFSNAIIGGVIGMLLLGFFGLTDFIPLWSATLSLVLGFIIILWRSE